MIDLLIFHINIIVAIYAFTKNWQKGSTKDGVLAILLIGLIFTIGWALTASFAYAIWPKKWNTLYFTHDTLSLVLLFIPEIFFFYHFFFNDKSRNLPNPDNNL
ncbi:MAG TPA: hypothetical protein DCW42_05240 [Bacteroidetes bacterium]|nr:hypothetical protein [Bacteroidota bacterium]